MQRLLSEGKLTPAQRSCFVTPRPKEELYDVKADPHSLKNLASDESKAGELKKLRMVMDEWIKRTNDRVPDKPTPDKFDRKTGVQLKARGSK